MGGRYVSCVTLRNHTLAINSAVHKKNLHRIHKSSMNIIMTFHVFITVFCFVICYFFSSSILSWLFLSLKELRSYRINQENRISKQYRKEHSASKKKKKVAHSSLSKARRRLPGGCGPGGVSVLCRNSAPAVRKDCSIIKGALSRKTSAASTVCELTANTV